MTGIEPQLWVQGANAAVTFYQAAFDAVVLHRVGDGDDIVAQLGVRDARFWVTEANENMKRYSPRAIGGTTGRTLLVVDEPEAFLRQAVQNLSIDQHRRERQRTDVAIEELRSRNALIATESTPEELLQAEQRLVGIRTVLDAESRRTRDIYFAHRAGYSYAEIAQHLGISHMTIKRHIARALLALMDQGANDTHGIAKGAAE